MNQIFALTCMASFVLQLFGSIVSWSLNSPKVGGPTATRSFRRLSFHRGRQDKENRDGEQDANVDDAALEEQYLHPPPHSGRLRILLGILTADFYNDQAYRRRHRMLFQIWNDPRVCSLPDFKSLPINERYRCQIIYTFVMGGNPHATPELVDDSRPMLATKPVKGMSTDLNDADVTLLNIRENMNEGKSQTWMKHGAEIAEEYDLDYVVKCDADALLHLHEFFKFAYVHLPPAPYNKNIFVGALRDKAYWPKHKTEEERIRFESFFGNNFEGVHLYIAGQIYMMSTDLAKFVGQEALASNCSYCEGHEDHDISAMAFHSPHPVKIVAVGRKQRFWEHPVKGEPRWKRIWARETARMSGTPFEEKMFDKNSTFEAVMAAERRHRG
jgi:Galactosyltransferase